ncbi:MAG: winged helix-turn-helix transcriptional regulator [Clostridia bacterium]|nr:winged helix-turn-helix transcriptional regulator [Clostridia bacterium]
MNPTRFIHFTQMVDTTQKCVRRLELFFAPLFDVKGVHIFWLYELQQHPEGLTAAELAHRRMVDRSLISRELDDLKRKGLIEAKSKGGKNYNTRLVLTDKGKETAKRIGEAALSIQNDTSSDISEEELSRFYATFEKIRDRLMDIAVQLGNETPTT